MNDEPKKQEPEIMPPGPKVEPERPGPEIPSDKDVPERKSHIPSRQRRLAMELNLLL